MSILPTVTVSDLPAAGPIAGSEVLPIVQHGDLVRATVTSIVKPRAVTIPFQSNIVVDWSSADAARIVLTGPANIAFVGAADGQKCLLTLVQGGTGGNTINVGSNIGFGSDLAAIVLSTAAGKTDKLGFIYDAATNKYDYVAIMRGF